MSFREEGLLPSNFYQMEELSALLIKITIFPYKDINDVNLDRKYESCPLIERFADVFKKRC